jgi:putative oxidoreductase
MRIAATVSRYLLGIIFLISGLNGFFHFIPQPPMPEGPVTQLMGAYMATHYLVLVFAIQLAAAILFLVNRYVPLALTLIAPVIVNIVMFHALMLPSGLPLAGVVVMLWLVLFYRERSAFAGIMRRIS